MLHRSIQRLRIDARLAGRGLSHYRREHLLVAAATAVAVSVLVGALVVGDSVRGSLRAAFTERLGAADFAVLPVAAFSDTPDTGLAARLAAAPEYRLRFAEPVPVFRLSGTVFPPDAPPVPVTVFGVDERFFRFHGLSGRIPPGAARISSGLRRAGIEPGSSLLVRVGEHAEVAPASLYGDKDDAAVTLRRAVEPWPAPAPGAASGDFALFPGQGAPRAVFLPLSELQRALDDPGRVNALLIRRLPAGEGRAEEDETVLARSLAAASSLDERGLSLQPGNGGEFVLESRSLVLADSVVEAALAAADSLGSRAAPVLTYLATAIRAGGRETPYSLVAGLPAADLPAAGSDLLFPGAWLAEDLSLAPGDPVELSYLVWEEHGRFGTAAVSLVAGPAASSTGVFGDPTLAPEFPGVSDSEHLRDWDPPFPVDLTRIRERDERYWEDHRTLPKAFVPLATAQRLWAMRQGSATSVRFEGGDRRRLAAALAAALPPADFGLVPIPVRRQGLEASRGATDFGTYFLYFSGFLLVSAFVLLALLYRLGIERRLGEIGLLLACGWPVRRVASTLLLETGVVAFLGALAGAAAGVAYAFGMIGLLSGAWEGAVAGTLLGEGPAGDASGRLSLFVGWRSIAMGSLGGLEMAMLAGWWTTRSLVRRSPRALLLGDLASPAPAAAQLRPAASPGRGARRLAAAAGILGGALLVSGWTGAIAETGGFFGAGAALLTAFLLLAWSRLRDAADPKRRGLGLGFGRGLRGSGLRSLGFRAASFRPGRSLAAMALVAFAAFTLVAVESFRKRPDPERLPAGAGGFLALTETVFGAPWNPTDAAGRDALHLPPDLEGFRIRPLRLAGGEDASCRNLYRPARPRVVGIPREFAEENRFPFAAHLGRTTEEIDNPWRLLWGERDPTAAIPVLGDQNSMTYVLKWPVGEERTFPIGEGGASVRLRLVGTLWDSLFQGELLMAEEDLLDRLPAADGYRMFLTDRTPAPDSREDLAAAEAAALRLLGEALADYGAVSTSVRARLADFHRVENTYLSTFQALGGLGLLLGTLGLGAVLFRNADERRREWGLLAATGYRPRDFAALGFWENALLLLAGLASGTGAALLAIFPLLGERQPGGSVGLVTLLLLGVLGFGLLAGALAARSAAGGPLLAALRRG